MDMPNIPKELKRLEKERGVRVLLAVENGARNWGLESSISDYDVRFIFVHPIRRYLKLEKPPEVINFNVDEMLLDMQGFDVYKFVGLLAKSNANLMEWLMSTMVYKETISQLIAMARDFVVTSFNPMAVYYHYHAMGYNNFSEGIIKGKKVTAKSYLYAFRGLFNALYVLEHKEFPPMDFKDIVIESDLVPEEIKRIILETVIPAKIDGKRGELVKRITPLDVYLEGEFRKRKKLHKEAREIMKRKIPLPSNIDDLIYWELVKT